MAYPKILNKEGTTLAHLNNCTECFIDEEINGAYTLSFVCTVDDLKTQFLYDENNIIEVNDDLFRALIIEELHTENNELTVSVDCEHISYDLLKTTFDTFSYPYATAALVMTQCLQATGFAFTGTDVTLKTDINYQEESNAKQISIAIANNWKGELQYHRHNIHLWDKRGANRGVDFRFGKNIKGIKKTLDRSKRDSGGNPTVSYEIDVVELKHLEEYKDLEYFELGDTVRVVDDMLRVNIQARIVKRTYNVLTETNESITLGNVLEDIRGSLSGIQDNVNKVQGNVNRVQDNVNTVQTNVDDVNATIRGNKPNWDKINKITNDLGNVIAGKLEGEMDLAQASITNSTGTFEQLDNMLYWQNQPTKANSTFASRWNALGMSFANSKLPNGDWIWQSALTAEGLIATKVLASAISTLSLEAVNILATKFTGQEINGLTINGSTINGSTIYVGDKASGKYISLEPYAPFEVYTNHKKMVEIFAGDTTGGYLFINNPDGRENLRIQATGDNNRVDLMCDDLFIRGTPSPASEEKVTFGSDIFTDKSITFTSRRINTKYYRDGIKFENSGTNNVYAIENKTGSIELRCKDFYVSGGGTKSAVVKTEHFGDRLLYCEESDRVYFNTKGVAGTHGNKYIIRLDDVFCETIEPNSKYPYIINVTPYGEAHIWVSSVLDKYIIVASDADCKFAYNIQCVRKDYGGTYLEERNLRNERLNMAQQ